MNNFFASVFNGTTATAGNFFLCVAVAFAAGLAFAFICYFRSQSSKSFFITTALLPMTVAVVIILVNGNIGAGVAVAGAFSLVRFRSAAGTAKEICIIFAAMTAGLAFGMGYLAYGAIFILAAGGAIAAFSATKIWEKKSSPKEKKLRVTIPEDLDYTTVFDEVLGEYAEKYELVKVKSINMGSMFRVSYLVTLKNPADEKKMLDDIRTRNGNLEVMLERTDFEPAEL